MKYMMTNFSYMEETHYSITTTADDKNFVSFPATVGIPEYDQFLVDSKLTDEQVKALKPDVWYDFPKASK